MRIVFMGSSGFATPSLQGLVRDGHDICMVYSQAPSPAGRGKKLRRTPVHDLADHLGLTVSTPARLDQSDIDRFRQLAPDIAVLVAYGKLIPTVMLEIPDHGFLNVHPSLLPRWRGAAPVQRAIMAGDRQTGVCIIRMNSEFDAGPVLLTRTENITGTDTSSILADRLAHAGAALLLEALTGMDSITPMPQSRNGISYAHKIDKREARICWDRPAAEVDATIRGLALVPGAWSIWNGKRVRLLMSTLVDGDGPAGTVLDDQLTVACGTGAVRLLRVQPESGKIMDGTNFMRGHGKAGSGSFE